MNDILISITSFYLILAIFVALISGIIRGYAGFASGLILVPIFTLLFSPIEGIAVAAIASSAGGIQLIPSSLKSVYWPELAPTLISAAFAASIGVLFLVSNEPKMIKLIMGIILIGASIVLMTGWTYRGVRNVYTSLVAGTMAGGALGAFGLPAGQFFALYFVSSPQVAVIQRANIIVCASTTVFFLLGGLIFNNQVTVDTVYRALFITPIFMLGTWLGTRLFLNLPIKWFSKIIYFLMAITGISLLFL